MAKKMSSKRIRIEYIIALCIGLAIIIYLCFQSVKFWSPTRLERNNFSSEEQAFILSYLDIDSSEAHVEKMNYTHARESVFTICITGLDDENLKPYKLSMSSENLHVEVSAFNGHELRCYFDEFDGRRMVVFSLYLYDEALYDIVKKVK